MTKTIRVQLRRKRGWKMPENTVKVDRATPWGNPFVVGQHGNRGSCVAMHAQLLSGHICLTEGPDPTDQVGYYKFAWANMESLVGKNLACWCPLDSPCHADTLLRAAQRLEELQQSTKENSGGNTTVH